MNYLPFSMKCYFFSVIHENSFLSSARINLKLSDSLHACASVCVQKREKAILVPDIELWEMNTQVLDLSHDDFSQEDCGH